MVEFKDLEPLRKLCQEFIETKTNNRRFELKLRNIKKAEINNLTLRMIKLFEQFNLLFKLHCYESLAVKNLLRPVPRYTFSIMIPDQMIYRAKIVDLANLTKNGGYLIIRGNVEVFKYNYQKILIPIGYRLTCQQSEYGEPICYIN